MSDSGFRIREKVRAQSASRHRPGFAAIVGPEGAGCRDRGVHPPGIAGVDENRVETHASGARHPVATRRVVAQRREFSPGLSAIDRTKERRILYSGEDDIGVGVGGLEVPDSLEVPRMGGSVVPLVCTGGAFEGEFVADRLPRPASVIGSLHDLTVPVRPLGGIDAVRVCGRSANVHHLPSAEVRTLDLPVPPAAIRFEDERTLPGTDEYSNLRHDHTLAEFDYGGRTGVLRL